MNNTTPDNGSDELPLDIDFDQPGGASFSFKSNSEFMLPHAWTRSLAKAIAKLINSSQDTNRDDERELMKLIVEYLKETVAAQDALARSMRRIARYQLCIYQHRDPSAQDIRDLIEIAAQPDQTVGQAVIDPYIAMANKLADATVPTPPPEPAPPPPAPALETAPPVPEKELQPLDRLRKRLTTIRSLPVPASSDKSSTARDTTAPKAVECSEDTRPEAAPVTDLEDIQTEATTALKTVIQPRSTLGRSTVAPMPTAPVPTAPTSSVTRRHQLAFTNVRKQIIAKYILPCAGTHDLPLVLISMQRYLQLVPGHTSLKKPERGQNIAYKDVVKFLESIGYWRGAPVMAVAQYLIDYDPATKKEEKARGRLYEKVVACVLKYTPKDFESIILGDHTSDKVSKFGNKLEGSEKLRCLGMSGTALLIFCFNNRHRTDTVALYLSNLERIYTVFRSIEKAVSVPSLSMPIPGKAPRPRRVSSPLARDLSVALLQDDFDRWLIDRESAPKVLNTTAADRLREVYPKFSRYYQHPGPTLNGIIQWAIDVMPDSAPASTAPSALPNLLPLP